MTFNLTFRYIDDVLSINNDNFHTYVNTIYPNELEIKDTTESSTHASYLDILLSVDTDKKLTTKLYDKRDDFDFSIVNFPHLSSNIPQSPAYGVYISQMIRYARACSTYEHFIYRGKLLTDKLLKQEYRKSRLKSTFRKFYGRYKYLVCDYSVSLNEMLRYLFNGSCWSVCTNCDEELFLTFFTDSVLWTRGGCDRSAGDAYSSMAPDPTSCF